MATQPETGLTYDDLQAFPKDNYRRELIEGELIVTAAPSLRHQQVVGFLTTEFTLYAREHGGKVFPAPTDVYFTDDTVLEPDVLYVRAENTFKLEERFVRSAPDIVVEVSSLSTRSLELSRKLEVYERFSVPEYWYVDLEANRIEIHRLAGGRYGRPEILMPGDSLESPLLPGFSAAVTEVLGRSPR